MFISSRQENHRKTSARRLLLIIFDSVIAYRDISGTTKPIDVNSTLCAATLTLRIIKRVSKKGVMITATNNQFDKGLFKITAISFFLWRVWRRFPHCCL